MRRVRTTRGDIEAETVIIACGVWSPQVARMAGASIPLTPAVHQMIDVGPVPRFADSKSHIEYPIVRDMDTNMYERQDGSGLEIGSYAHRPILHDPEEIPSVEEAALSPTEFPFTQADFEQQMEHALELMPEIVGDESVGVKYAINGLLSLTPDGMPILGETPEVGGLWSVAAVWVKEGPGIGRSVAQWMVHGESEIDLHSSDISRFWEHQKTRTHVRARAAEGFNKTYGIVHPGEQWASNRNVRLSPFHLRAQELGAVFYEAAGWERPHWYESNAPLLEEYGDRLSGREAEWDARWWSPIINAEHLAMRDRAGIVDLTAFAIFDIAGPGALECVQGLAVRQMDVPVGRVVYTPILAPGGGFKADLTIMRLGDQLFRVVTGGAHGAADRKWFADHLPADGSAQLVDVTSAWCTLGLWGPRARDILSSVTSDDVSHEGFRFGSCRTIEVDTLRVLASRISYVGDLGWELYVPIEQGAQLWDIVWEAGRPHGLAPVGSASTAPPAGSRSATGPTASSWRASTTRSRRAWPRQGEGRGLRRQGGPPAPPRGGAGGDPVHPDRRRPHVGHAASSATCSAASRSWPATAAASSTRKGRGSYVTSAGAGPSIGKHILLAYLPPEQARRGRAAAGRVPGRALPGDGRRRRPDAGLRPREHEDPLVNVLVCVKRVPMTGGRIVLTPDEQAIETRHLGFTISPHEECARRGGGAPRRAAGRDDRPC